MECDRTPCLPFYAHAPLPEFPALPPAPVPLALPAVASGLRSVALKVSPDGALVCAPGLDIAAAQDGG
jgi:hypothetical protein